jgi:hypothetical protein
MKRLLRVAICVMGPVALLSSVMLSGRTAPASAAQIDYSKNTLQIAESGPDCYCPHQLDFDSDGFTTAIDLGILIDILFAGAQNILDPLCWTTRADLDCDGFATALDLQYAVIYLFEGGNPPCNPCSWQ